MSKATARLGLRREARLFLPFSALILLGLSTFTLFSYRRAVTRLVTERRDQVRVLARSLANEVGARGAPRDVDLSRFLDRARSLSVLGGDGLPVRAVGLTAEGNLLTPLGGVPPTAAVAVGPDRTTGPRVVGFVPIATSGAALTLRVDLDAAELDSIRRSLRLLTWIVLIADVAVIALLARYLGHLLRPLDQLMDRARMLESWGPADGVSEEPDEVAFLLRSFDRAISELRRRETESTGAGRGGAAEAARGDRAKADEEELGRLERTLEGSLESGLLLLDEGGAVLALNDVGAGLLGIVRPGAGEAVRPGAGEADRPVAGETADRLLAAQPQLLASVRRCLARGEGALREQCSVTLPSGERTLGFAVHPLRRRDRSVRGWMLLFVDLTEIRRQDRERQLSESLSRVGELTAGLAHELRNGLASLRGYLTLLERHRPRTESDSRDADFDDSLREIRQETDHLHRVLQDFLSFARPGTVRLEEVDLERLAHHAAADPALSGAAVRVVRSGQAPLPRVAGDSQLLERALRNLLLNAVRAHAETEPPVGQPVEVRLESRGTEVVLTVEDRGPGIAADLEDRLFVPFASSRPGGTGLGLALSRRIAELHNAVLTLENRAGGGAVARLCFPLNAGETATKGNPDPGSG